MLRCATTYYLQVLSLNSFGTCSPNSSIPVAFTTVIPLSLPVSTNFGVFDDSMVEGSLPPMWVNDPSDGGADWVVTPGSMYGPPIDHTSPRVSGNSGRCAVLDDSTADGNSDTNLITPVFKLPSDRITTLLFQYYQYHNSSQILVESLSSSSLALDVAVLENSVS